MIHRELHVARRLAARVAKAGGRAYFVGGYVRDRLMGLPGKDIDLEIHGLAPEALEAILRTLGEPTVMGASFGVFGLKHYDLDIAMPRREKATGRGHRDFTVEVDPFLGPEKAAARRDFTVNALMEDVLTGELLDPYHGREDLQKGVLRHVSDATFGEDPLRVLRAAQFSARFAFPVAPETVALARQMDLAPLPRERVMGELEKALRKAPRPSRFFAVLREMGQLSPWFPEVEALIGVPQDPLFHPEGDVWNHTMRVLDEAAALRELAREPLALMLAALTHDFGKAVATAVVNGHIHAYGHDVKGQPLIAALLGRLTGEVELTRRVLNLSALHMRPPQLVAQGSSPKAYRKLYDEALCPEDLLLLAKADALGSGAPSFAPAETKLLAMLADYRALMAESAVRGQDLVDAGFAPGPDFKDALALAHKLHLAGVSRKEALKQTAAFLEKSRKKAARP